MELFPTFNNVGVTIKLDSSNTECEMGYCIKNSGECYEGHEMSKVSSQKFVTSIFWLTENTEYEVTVKCGTETLVDSVTTKKTKVFPTKANGMITKSLYVSPSGTGNCESESNPCSLKDMFSSYKSKIEAGTEILFEDGEYYHNDYGTFDSNEVISGTSEHPIVFRPKNKDGNVVLDGGTRVSNSAWTSEGNGIYRMDYSKGDSYPNVVIQRNSDGEFQRLLKYSSMTRLQSLYFENYEGYYIDTNNNYMYINLGSKELSEHTLIYVDPDAAYNFLLRDDYFYFFDLTMKHLGTKSYRMAIYLRGASNCWFKGCKFHQNMQTFSLEFHSEYNLIEDCEFVDSEYEAPWDGIKDDNGDKGIEVGAINFRSRTGKEEGDVVGRGLVLRRNTFDNFFDAFNFNGGCDTTSDYNLVWSNEIDIHDNKITRIADDGFELDGYSQNVRVYNNRIEYTKKTGISFAPNEIGPVFVINNTLTNQEGWGNFKFQYSTTPESGFGYFYHNTIHNKISGQGFYISATTPWQKQKYRNNIVFGYERGMTIGSGIDHSTIDLDYNVYAKDASDDEHPTYFKFDDQLFTSLSDFQSSSNYELHGVWIDDTDVFKNDNFELKDDSILNSGGEFIPGINHIVDSNSPNFGLMFTENSENPTDPVEDPLASFFSTPLPIIIGVSTLVVLLLVVVVNVIIVSLCCWCCVCKKKKENCEELTEF